MLLFSSSSDTPSPGQDIVQAAKIFLVLWQQTVFHLHSFKLVCVIILSGLFPLSETNWNGKLQETDILKGDFGKNYALLAIERQTLNYNLYTWAGTEGKS